jgi:hypothetical protein
MKQALAVAVDDLRGSRGLRPTPGAVALSMTEYRQKSLLSIQADRNLTLFLPISDPRKSRVMRGSRLTTNLQQVPLSSPVARRRTQPVFLVYLIHEHGMGKGAAMVGAIQGGGGNLRSFPPASIQVPPVIGGEG